MNDVVIRAVALGKKYRIGAVQEGYRTFRDTLTKAVLAPFRRAGKLLRGQASGAAELDETFWALKDVSFECQAGEIIGIIGRNGAGKSTLLKILSRITEPTAGFAEIRGRVGTLLEVGTGFHPELTGRENIYLNGAILGMKRAQFGRKFDEIVDFAEVEKFLDTPVKHYSSGMYLRLAFAVAAHLEPEILLVDEVLAVGDAAFQKKCLGKMGEVRREGRTVLFVSHNLAAMQNLCSRIVVLEQGMVVFNGSVNEGVEYYVRSISAPKNGQSHLVDLRSSKGRSGKFPPLLKRMEFFTEGRPLNGCLPMGAPLSVHIHFTLEKSTPSFVIGLGFDSLFGERIFTAHTSFDPDSPREVPEGTHVFVCEIPSLTLVPGEYKITAAMATPTCALDAVEDAARLTVLASDYYGTGRVPWNGKFVLKHRWYRRENASLKAKQERLA